MWCLYNIILYMYFFIRRTKYGATNIHNTCVFVSYRPEPTTPNRSAHVSVEGDHRTSPPDHSVSRTYGSRQSNHRSEESASTHYEYVCVCKVQLDMKICTMCRCLIIY